MLENPVLQRELLVNLRTARAFLLLAGYNVALGLVVFLAWPPQQHLDLTRRPDEAKGLVELFFIGQYVLASLMAPSFAAGTITGEKERKTYEMLLASPLRPRAIVLGKLFASLAPLAILIFSSLPIVMLCLPLGGVSLYEVLAAYLALMLSVASFGMISVSCSSYFMRTSSALIVSYLLILPLALAAVWSWSSMASAGEFRLWWTVTVLPVVAAAICSSLFVRTTRRLLHPPDVGSEGNEVVDLEAENEKAVGMVIQFDQFPDRLLAPAKRTTLLPDGANPVFDKELRSEIFSQGTLMLRLVVQVSMLLALPLMAIFLYWKWELAAWYISYVLLFNMLVGPVFSAGSVTSERERQTLDLLLTTIISPFQILWGKLVAGWRVSAVLTGFLIWPLLLAWVMGSFGWSNVLAPAAYLTIIVMTSMMTSTLALFCSVLFRKTATSMMTTYLVLVCLFCLPLALRFFAETYFPGSAATGVIRVLNGASPFAAALSVPLAPSAMETVSRAPTAAVWNLFFGYLGFSAALILMLLGAIIWLFNTRWRVAE